MKDHIRYVVEEEQSNIVLVCKTLMQSFILSSKIGWNNEAFLKKAEFILLLIWLFGEAEKDLYDSNN